MLRETLARLADTGVSVLNVVRKLSLAVQEAYIKPQVQTTFAERGVEALASTPEQLSALIRRDMELWGRVFANDTGAGFDFLGLVEASAVLGRAHNFDAFGEYRNALDLVNSYAPYSHIT